MAKATGKAITTWIRHSQAKRESIEYLYGVSYSSTRSNNGINNPVRVALSLSSASF
jgi:hypothetical protein